MSTIRIAVASTPLTATLEEAVPAAIAAVEEAARLGARIVCLPETGLPGHRVTTCRDRAVGPSGVHGRWRDVRDRDLSRGVSLSGDRARALVLGGAQIIFVPHFVTTDDGSLPTQWCAAENPYNEKSLLCRALENTERNTLTS